MENYKIIVATYTDEAVFYGLSDKDWITYNTIRRPSKKKEFLIKHGTRYIPGPMGRTCGLMIMYDPIDNEINKL